MRMRLKPLRGQTYETRDGEKIKFLENIDGTAKIVRNDYLANISMNDLVLPIIDTKDYEKIPDDESHRGA